MKETIKKAFLGGIVFLGIVILGFYGFATYTNLPTQNTGYTITQSILNDVISKINNIGNNVDTLSGSISGLYTGMSMTNFNKCYYVKKF